MSDNTGAADPVSEMAREPKRHRPILVWIIFAWTCYSLVALLAGAGVALFSDPHGNVRAGVPIAHASPSYHLLMAITGAVLFAGGLALFKLRTKAVRLLLFAVGLYTVSAVYMAATLRAEDFPPPRPGMDERLWQLSIRSGLVFGDFLGIATTGAIAMYAMRLRRRGLLL